MSVDPREQWQKIQQRLQQSGRAGFGGGLPSGGAAGRGFIALVAVGLGAVVLSNSIFNGMWTPRNSRLEMLTDIRQWMVVTELSNTRG